MSHFSVKAQLTDQKHHSKRSKRRYHNMLRHFDWKGIRSAQYASQHTSKCTGALKFQGLEKTNRFESERTLPTSPRASGPEPAIFCVLKKTGVSETPGGGLSHSKQSRICHMQGRTVYDKSASCQKNDSASLTLAHSNAASLMSHQVITPIYFVCLNSNCSGRAVNGDCVA